VLNLATDVNSPAHYAKGTPSPILNRAPTACRYMVSGTFNSPKRGAFHRSLTLLCTIGYRGVLSLGGWAPQLHTRFHESRATLVHQKRKLYCKVQDFHLLWPNFPDRSYNMLLCNSIIGARNPGMQARRFGLVRFRSPLLTESRLIFFPAGTKMFQFSALASTAYEFSR
jgi:hypothetical protein